MMGVLHAGRGPSNGWIVQLCELRSAGAGGPPAARVSDDCRRGFRGAVAAVRGALRQSRPPPDRAGEAMTPQQVRQVQASFSKVEPIADQAAALFYRRLFETAPEVRALFSGDMEVQGRKLMTGIATVVDSLGEIAAVAPAVCDLAKRHV